MAWKSPRQEHWAFVLERFHCLRNGNLLLPAHWPQDVSCRLSAKRLSAVDHWLAVNHLPDADRWLVVEIPQMRNAQAVSPRYWKACSYCQSRMVS